MPPIVPTVYLKVRDLTIKTKSSDPRFDGAVFTLASADVCDEDIRGDVAIALRVSPFRPARLVVLRCIQGGLAAPPPPSVDPRAA